MNFFHFCFYIFTLCALATLLVCLLFPAWAIGATPRPRMPAVPGGLPVVKMPVTKIGRAYKEFRRAALPARARHTKPSHVKPK